MGELGKEFGVDFGKRNSDKDLNTYLKEQDYPLMAKILTTIDNKRNEN